MTGETMTRSNSIRSTLGLFAAAVTLVVISLASSPASAAYITVYGAPGYTPGVGGYGGYPGFDEIARIGAVNDAGTAVVGANKYNAAGVNIAGAALRWNASGGAELANLGVSPTGYPNSAPFAINNAGTAVGYSIKGVISGPPLGIHAVRWAASGTTATELGDLGSFQSLAYDINETGTAVGYSWKLNAGQLAVRWNASGTTPTELGHLGTNADGYTSAAATAINDAGTTIGYCVKFTSSGTSLGRYAVRWNASGTAATELGHVGAVPPYDSFYSYGPTAALGINNAGTVVGYSEVLEEGQTAVYPVRWDASSTVPTLLSPPGWPYRINDAGVAVGEGPTRWDASGAATPLESQGNFSGIAKDINEAGVAVGFWEVGGRRSAVYWNPDGSGLDLNSLIDPASGWTLDSAEDISETGWIFGIGGFDPDGPGGQAAYARSFIMQVPATVPEPSVLALLSLAVSALLRRQRRSIPAACCESLEERRLLSFSAAANYPVGTSPQEVVTADFNKDGKLDVATASVGSNSVNVRLGNGAGGFGAAVDFPTGAGPNCMAVGDFNRDGKPDLVTGSETTGKVSVLLGNGSGAFAAPIHSEVDPLSVQPLSIAVGDLGQDGTMDLLVGARYHDPTGEFDDTGEVAVLVGNNTGSFSWGGSYGTGVGMPTDITAVDLNDDSILDIMTTWDSDAFAIVVFIRPIIDWFPDFYGTAAHPQALALGDFTGEGKLDVITAGDTIDVLPGDGHGAFGESINQPVGGGPYTSVEAGDFNGDGKLDAVATDGAHSTVEVLLGNGDGTLRYASAFVTGSLPSGVAVGDFNGDGRPDVATANAGSNNVSVLLNDGVWGGSKSFVGPGGGAVAATGPPQTTGAPAAFRRQAMSSRSPANPSTSAPAPLSPI
jgi:hypothetical protein